jgi:hypothetical protein
VWASAALPSSQHRLLRSRGSRHRRQGIRRWIEERTGSSTRRFVRTSRRHRAIEIQVGNHNITAADPLPDDIHTTVAAITQCAH